MVQTILAVIGIVKWPIVVLVIGLAALGKLKTDLGALIGRIKSFGPKGFETSPALPPSQAGEPAVATTGLAGSVKKRDLLETVSDPLVRRVEDKLKKSLEEFDPADHERALLRAAANVSIQLHFERSYALIYGSQLSALEFLNSVKSAPRDSLLSFYTNAASKHPVVFANFSFDQWLGFLLTSWLASEDAAGVAITIDGRAFLKFIIDRGYAAYAKQF